MDDCVDLTRQGNAMFVDESYEEALELYDQAIRLSPTHTDAYARRAQCLLKLNRAEEALEDADKALAIDETHEMALLRRGAALLALNRPREALLAIEKGAKIRDAPQFSAWLRKAKMAVADLNEDEKVVEGRVETPVAVQEAAAVKGKFRHDWYQSGMTVTVEIFAKKVSSEEAEIEFREDRVVVRLKERDFTLDVPLFGKIVPPKCEVKYYGTKVALLLAKQDALQWAQLERAVGHTPLPVVINPGASTDAGAAAKTRTKLASFEKNWDALAGALVEEEKPEGEAALNALFKQIYADGSDEQRKAMQKSFVESGGTCLSTNWEDVGKRKVEVTPPEGMEAKKWEQ